MISPCRAVALLACAITAPAVAQTSINTPWVTSSVLGLPSLNDGGLMAVSPTGDLWVQTYGVSLPPPDQANQAPDLKQGNVGSDPYQLFVRKYTADGTGILYETTYATNSGPGYNLISVDSQGVASVVGQTPSPSFPMYHATAGCTPGVNTYLVRLSPGGEILQSTLLAMGFSAGPDAVSVQSNVGYIAVSASGLVWLVQVSPDPAGLAGMVLGCYANGADFTLGVPAPGEISTLFGEGLGPPTGVSYQWGGHPVPTSLGGVTVTFGGTPAPLLYVQSSQINLIAPWEIAGKSQTQLCVSYSGTQNCISVPVAEAAPGIFRHPYAGVEGGLAAAAVNQDGTLNCTQEAAPMGSIVSLYGTGFGLLSPVPQDGSIIQPPLPTIGFQMTANFLVPLWPGGTITVSAPVFYAGPAPFEIGGMYQVNVEILEGVALGALQLALEAPGGTSFGFASAPICIQ